MKLDKNLTLSQALDKKDITDGNPLILPDGHPDTVFLNSNSYLTYDGTKLRYSNIFGNQMSIIQITKQANIFIFNRSCLTVNNAKNQVPHSQSSLNFLT